jgi:hypothetical protein
MNELNIPRPLFQDHQVAEVEVTINGKKKRYSFRVESFPWVEEGDGQKPLEKIGETALKIQRLKESIEQYDKDWEIFQIYTPAPCSRYIQVLFRKKTIK